jgi:MoaA/NifB/PqqE/SkfB family radical SAM enzyme
VTRRSPIAEALPRQIYVEVTNRCNSRCQTCIRTFQLLEPLRDLKLAEFEAILNQFPILERIVLHGIGEPLLNPELGEMIRFVKGRHPSAVTLFNSNAILLNDSQQQALVDARLDEYRVSLDAATATTYTKIRGVDAFDTVIDNIGRFVRLLRERKAEGPRLSLWLAAMRENLDELPGLVRLAAEIGVPEVYVQRLVLTHRGLARSEQSLHRRLRAQEDVALAHAARWAADNGVALRASGLTSPRKSLDGQGNRDLPWSACHRLWTSTYITAHGNVLPCCISPFSATDYASLILGNVFETPFAQIWNDRGYLERRARLYTDHPLHPCELCGTSWSL